MLINNFPKSIEITAVLKEDRWQVTGFTTGCGKGELSALSEAIGLRSHLGLDASAVEIQLTHGNGGYYMSSESFPRYRQLYDEMVAIERRRIFLLS